MNQLIKIVLSIAMTVVVILGVGKIAMRNYQQAIIHRQAQQGGLAVSASGGDYSFEGDLFAQMPSGDAVRSTPAEDQQRAREAATFVRVIFEKESHPQFAGLVKAALLKHWNPNLGYQLVFGESRGPLETAATPVTLRIKVRTYAAPFQQGKQPEVQQFFRAVDLMVYSNQREVPTSWDLMTLAAEDPLPAHFTLGAGGADAFNRKRLGHLYQAFGQKLDGIPAFRFFPAPDFDAIRGLYVWPRPDPAEPAAVDPAVFAQTAERLVKNYNRPLYKGHLDAICCHLLTNNATNYVDGIAVVLSEWLPHVPPERLELLRTNLAFANYALMKTLLRHRQGYLLFKSIPEVWTDPGLAEFSRSYWREKQGSSELAWMAREFADRLGPTPAAAATTPPKTPHIYMGSAPAQSPGASTIPPRPLRTTNAVVLGRAGGP